MVFLHKTGSLLGLCFSDLRSRVGGSMFVLTVCDASGVYQA